MGVKKKIVASTIAVAVASSAIVLYPLSSKGLAEQYGIVNVASATPVESTSGLTVQEQAFVDRLQAVYSALAIEDVADVIALYEETKTLTTDDYKALVSPMWDVLEQNVNVDQLSSDDLAVVTDALFTILQSPTSETIANLKSSEELKNALSKLSEAFNDQNQEIIDTLEPSDLINTALAFETELHKQTLSGNVDRLLSSTERNIAVADAITAMFNATTKDKLIKILAGLGVQADALIQTVSNFNNSSKLEHFEAVQNAFIVAYVKANSSVASVVSNNGRTHTYTLKLFEGYSHIGTVTVPASMVTWRKAAADTAVPITISSSGVAILADSVAANTETKAKIEALIEGKVVYQGQISMTYVPSGSGSGGGGLSGGGSGGGNTDETETGSETGSQSLDDLLDAIKNATGAEKDKLVDNAVKAAASEISKLATLDLSSNVKVVDGKASLAVDAAHLKEVFSKIAEKLSALEKAAPGASDKLPKTVVKLDLGNVDARDVNVGISADIVKEAMASGVNGVQLAFGGFSATLPLGGSLTGAIDFGAKTSEATSDSTDGKQAASDVYDFSLQVDGNPVSTFDEPIEIKIPVKVADGIDKELLTVAKIVDGKLLIQGGKLEGDGITESRTGFSQYVVVENDVTFKDISSVKSWAGRQIQVMAAKGAIEGRGEGVFAPKDQVTRAEFAKMLIHALELEGGKPAQAFEDVKGAEWFAPYVDYASNKGIINGRSATEFAPNANITRAEMAVMITRALAAKGVDVSVEAAAELKAFKDANQVHASLVNGVAFAVSKGLVVGNAGNLSPNANATRAEAAVMIYRAFNYEG